MEMTGITRPISTTVLVKPAGVSCFFKGPGRKALSDIVLPDMMLFLGADIEILFSSGCVTHLYRIKKISRFILRGLTPLQGCGLLQPASIIIEVARLYY